MAFGVKYRMDWIDRLGADSYRLDIETEGFVGAPTTPGTPVTPATLNTLDLWTNVNYDGLGSYDWTVGTVPSVQCLSGIFGGLSDLYRTPFPFVEGEEYTFDYAFRTGATFTFSSVMTIAIVDAANNVLISQGVNMSSTTYTNDPVIVFARYPFVAPAGAVGIVIQASIGSNTAQTFYIDSFIETVGSVQGGGIIGLGHTMDGFLLSYNENDWVQGFEGIFSFYVDQSVTAAYDTDFFASNYKEFKVKFYINFVLKNVGWLKPENSTRDVVGPVVQYRISFTDALNDLKQIKYTGFQLTGFDTILQTIKQALEFGGITDLDFFIQCNMIEDNLMTAGQNLFNVFRVLSDAFYKTEDGETEPDNCYVVLEKCIKPFYCRLAQVDGYWQITSGSEYVSERDIYAYVNDLTPVSENVAYNREVDINHFAIEGTIEQSTVFPINILRVIFNNKSGGINEVTNGNFTAGKIDFLIPGWNIDTWTLFDVVDHALVLTLTQFDDPTMDQFFSSDGFNIPDIGVGDRFLNWKFKLTLPLEDLYYSPDVPGDYLGFPPKFKVRITYPDDTFKETAPAVIREGEVTYELDNLARFPLTLTGFYSITIYYLPPAGALIYNITLIFDDISVTQIRGEATDTIFNQNLGTGFHEKEEELYFADGINVHLSDAGVLTDSNYQFSSSWTRFGQTNEQESLIAQFSQQYLNDNKGHLDLLTISGLIDATEQIHFNSILIFRSKKYRFINYEKNYKAKTISGSIQQVDNIVQVFRTEGKKSLLSQYGIPLWLKKGSLGFEGTARRFLESPFLNFEGSIGIGRDPTGRLHLPMVLPEQWSAPLKFEKASAGGRLRTPEDGAVEYYTEAPAEGGRDRVTMTVGDTRYEITNRIFLEDLDTSTPEIVFDFENQTGKWYKATHNLQFATNWTFINDQKLVFCKFKFFAASFEEHQFPVNVTMSDSRFDLLTNKWKAVDLGVYEGEFFFDGLDYLIKIHGPYKKVNAAPQIFDNVISYNSGTNLLSGGRSYSDIEGDLENNLPPTVLSFGVTGTPEPGDTLTLSYTFYSPSGYTQGPNSIQWYRAESDGSNESAIIGEIGTSYLLEQEDVGKLIFCKFIVSQIATAPANGNPQSAEISSNRVLIQAESTLPRLDLALYTHAAKFGTYDAVNFRIPNAGTGGAGTYWSSPLPENRPTYDDVTKKITFDNTVTPRYFETAHAGSAGSKVFEFVGTFTVDSLAGVNEAIISLNVALWLKVFKNNDSLVLRANQFENDNPLNLLPATPYAYRIRVSLGTTIEIRTQVNYDEESNSFLLDHTFVDAAGQGHAPPAGTIRVGIAHDTTPPVTEPFKGTQTSWAVMIGSHLPATGDNEKMLWRTLKDDAGY